MQGVQGHTLIVRVYLFNTYVTSLYLYKARFADIPRDIIRRYEADMQRITKAPWQSIPATGGLPGGVRDLRAEGLLAKARVVRDIVCFEGIEASIHAAADSNAALLWPWRPRHRTTTVFVCLLASRERRGAVP